MARYAPFLLLFCVPLIAGPGCGGGVSSSTRKTVSRGPAEADEAAGPAAGGAKPPAADEVEISRKII